MNFFFATGNSLPPEKKKKRISQAFLLAKKQGMELFLNLWSIEVISPRSFSLRSANLASVQLDKNKLCSTNKRRNWEIHHTKLMAPRNPNIYAYIYTCICVYIYIYILPNVSCALSLNVQWYLAEWMTWAVGRYFHTWTLYEPGEMQEWWAIG